MGTYYVALVQGEFVESGSDLGELVRLLREEIMDRDGQEDVVIYVGHRVAAVLLADGTDHLFEHGASSACEHCPEEGSGCSVCGG